MQFLSKCLCYASALFLTGAIPIAAQEVSPQDARQIAKDAYIWGFPIVDSYRIQYSYFIDQDGPEYKAPWNTIFNNARVYTPDDKAIQTPNSDTPYSYVGADLRGEPLVLTVPEIEAGRYYSLQFIDMHTFNFAYVGSRTTGNAAGSYLLAGPGWQGETPPGIKQVIRSETDFAFVLYRTQLFGPEDIDNVKKLQEGYRVEPLSSFLGQPPAPAPPAVDFPMPLSVEDERKSLFFFNELAFLMQFAPTVPEDAELRARMARIGLEPGDDIDPGNLSPEMRAAFEGGIAEAWAAFQKLKSEDIDTGKVAPGDFFGTREAQHGNTLGRMSAAVLGIYGNTKAEAMYPAYTLDSAGQPLTGAQRYRLRFPPGQLPPVNAFWSLTLYQMPESLLYANDLNRYLINSPMLPDLKTDDDGGLTLFIQHDPPAEAANWLPTPAGPFAMALRLYWPKPEALENEWKAPALETVD